MSTLIHNVTKHLEKAGNYIRIIFIYFSSAFNNMQRHNMIEKFLVLQIPPNFIHCMTFSADRPQHVKAGSNTAPNIITNTGATQGCIVSSIIYSLYTNDTRSEWDSDVLIQYADDAALNSFIVYENTVSMASVSCKEHFQELNVCKTKELCIDFRNSG